MVQDRRRAYVIHHDQLKLCRDRVIPMWVRRKRHEMFNLDETLPYDEAEQDPPPAEELDLSDTEPLLTSTQCNGESDGVEGDDHYDFDIDDEDQIEEDSTATSKDPIAGGQGKSVHRKPQTQTNGPGGSETQSNTQTVTRRGRVIKTPARLKD